MAVTVDFVLLTLRDDKLSVLLITRKDRPYKQMLALPGGFIREDEDAANAVVREVGEETGLDASRWHLEELRTYSAPDRDPRMRVISVAYLGFMPVHEEPPAGDDATHAAFVPADLVLEGAILSGSLAFDHTQIVADAIERCRAKLEYTTLATTFLASTFTLGELRRVYETVWGVELHPSNFQRKVRTSPGFVVPVKAKRSADGQGRPAARYRAGSAAVHLAAAASTRRCRDPVRGCVPVDTLCVSGWT